MTDFKALIEADTGQTARNIQLVDVGNFEGWLKGQPENIRALAAAYPMLSLGSYPFQKDGKYGAHVVIRGSDAGAVDAAMAQLQVTFP